MAGLIDYSVIQPGLANALIEQSKTRQMQQAAQERQNALADLQLRAAQRGEEEALAEREAYKGAATFGDVQQRLMQAGLGKQAIALQKQMQEQQAAKLTQAKIHQEISQGLLRKVYADGTRQSVNDALAEAEALGLPTDKVRALFDRTPDSDIKRVAFALAEGPKALQQQAIDTGTATYAVPTYALGASAAAAPVAAPATAVPIMPAGVPGVATPTRAMGANALAVPAPGMTAQAAAPYGMPGGITAYPKGMTLAQQATETREQQRIGLEQRRVELAEKEAARKEAGLAEPLSKQEIQKREAKYPQAKSSLTGFENQADDMIKKLEQLKNHKGLEGILGTVYGRTPSFTAESQAAQALYDQVLAKGKFQELQNMRLASPTGGALGNVSNMEIQSLGQAFGALSRIQGKESFKAAIDDVIKQIQSSKERTREAFDETYQYKQGKPAAAPTAGKAKFLGFE